MRSGCPPRCAWTVRRSNNSPACRSRCWCCSRACTPCAWKAPWPGSTACGCASRSSRTRCAYRPRAGPWPASAGAGCWAARCSSRGSRPRTRLRAKRPSGPRCRRGRCRPSVWSSVRSGWTGNGNSPPRPRAGTTRKGWSRCAFPCYPVSRCWMNRWWSRMAWRWSRCRRKRSRCRGTAASSRPVSWCCRRRSSTATRRAGRSQ